MVLKQAIAGTGLGEGTDYGAVEVLGTVLVCSLGSRDALIDGLATGESFVGAMPVGDGLFAQLPAEKDGAAFDLAGKVEQADVDVFYLHANGVDFRQGILGALLGFDALGFAAGQGDDIKKHSAIHEDSVLQRLLLSLDRLHQFLAGNRSAKKGLEHRQQGVGFVESKRPVGHGSILLHQDNRSGCGELPELGSVREIAAAFLLD